MSRPAALLFVFALLGHSQTPILPDDAEARRAVLRFDAVHAAAPARTQTRSLQPERDTGNLDPRLADLVAAAAGRSLAAPPPVRAAIEANTAAAIPALLQRLQSGGVQGSVSFENTLYATVPVSLVPAIAQWPDVRFVRIQDEFLPAQAKPQAGAFAPNLQRIGLESLNTESLKGKGVRIGIIDSGYLGLQALIDSGRVRPPVEQQAFPPSHGVQNHERHGAACAEIISGIAPAAELYIASFDGSEGSLIAAASWLISKHVRIISYSGGNPSAPTNGTDPVSRLIDRSTIENRVLWVVSSGNTATRHWSGLSDDVDGDGYIDISGRSPHLGVVPMEPKLSVTIRWNDWGADPRRPRAVQDIDAELVALDGAGKEMRVVAESTGRQKGPAARPVEWLTLEGKQWIGQHLAIRLKPTRLTRRVLVHVFVDSDAQVHPRTAERSVLSPSTAPMAVSVGGFDVVRDQLALYSAQGPTDDNRLKPELVAPTNVPSRTYITQGGRFAGTSASSPHAAALAALLIGKFQPATALELRSLLLQASSPLGNPNPNTLYGYGHLNAARSRATPGLGKPRSLGTETVTLSPELGGEITFAVLDELREAEPRQDLFTSRITTDRTLYQFGDAVSVSYSANAPAVCAVLHRSSSGVYTVLVPGQTLAAGETGSFPPPDQAMHAAAPAGREELLLICAKTEADLPTVDPGELSRELAVARAMFDVVLPFL